ncbi:MAG: extracellular solute-binding protein [Clostridia bacterium]|nr:extracellular solute-binding protein [Clostridia bacterium]
MKKRIVVFLMVFTLLALSACDGSNNGVYVEGGWNGILINNGKPITLLVDINQLIPTTNTVPTEQQPVVFRSTQSIADEFTEMFPNVTIQWAYSKKSVGDWAQWMTTQISTGDAPDIVMMHGAEYADRDWFVPLDDILMEPNVFVESGKGSVHWKDMFPEYMWLSDMTSDAKGRILAVPVTCYPGTATAYFYNKEIFAELNLEVPKTWEEFKTVCNRVNEAGYIAVAPWSLNAKANVDVWDVQFSLGPTYAEKIKDQWDYDGNGYMTQDELLRAVYEGVFYGQGKNRENILSMYNEIKYKYNNILQVGAADTDYEPLWNKGQVAMMEDGMWRLSAENVNAERKFEYGIFATPVADSTTSEYCADFEFGQGAYNPPVCESFNICKQAVEQKGEGHLQASKLFLMWLTAPHNINRIVDEKAGECVGSVYGTIIPAEIEDYIRGEFARTPSCQWTTGVTVATQTDMSRQFQYWIANRYDDARFLKNYDSKLYKGAVDMINALGIDTSGWKNGYDENYNY